MNCLIVLFLFIAGSLAADYCDPKLCQKYTASGYVTVPHIGCKPASYGPACDAKAQAFDATPYADVILKKFNTLRNEFASGKAGFPAAARMRELTWNNELAALAVLNTKQCDMVHDQCHNTAQFKYSGQNLAWSGTTGTIDISSAIDSAIQDWYDEKKDCTLDVLQKYFSKGGPATGHFTAVVCDRQTEIGCGYSLYFDGQYNSFLFACNLASTNMIGSPIYKSSPNAGSGCTKKSSSYPNLCDASEAIDANSFA